jgi:long-chain acyl-CoA synthetase
VHGRNSVVRFAKWRKLKVIESKGRAVTKEEAVAELTKPGAEYEVGTRLINGLETRFFKSIPQTLPEYFRIYRDEFAERTFLVWNDERWTYGEAYQKAATVAHKLKSRMGVKKGDRVAIACRNYPEWMFVFLGATSIGAIVVAVNAWWQGAELEYGLIDSGARILFADQERVKRLGDRLEELGIETIVIRPEAEPLDGIVSFDDFMTNEKGLEMPGGKVDPDEDILIMYTSGSTGKPKGSVSSHRNVLTALFTWKFNVDVGSLMNPPEPPPPGVPEIPGILLTVPLFHVLGSHVQFLSSWYSGRKVVMMYKWDAEEALRLIEKERITVFSGTPTLDWELMKAPSFGKTDLSSVTRVGGGGSPRPAGNVLRIDKEFPNAAPNIGWGMTETNAIGAAVAGDDYVARPSSTGAPAFILDFKMSGVRSGSRARRLFGATGTSPRPPPRPSPRAGSAPETWATSTMRAISTSATESRI